VTTVLDDHLLPDWLGWGDDALIDAILGRH
jgi:hypothetical protein